MLNLNFFLIISIVSHFFLFYILSKKNFIFFNKNRKKQIRWGDSNKSHYGGVAFYLTYLFFFIYLMLNNTLYILSEKFYILFIIISIISIYGLIDEKFILKAKFKFFFQLFISYILIKSGIELKLFFDQDLNFIFNLVWYLFFFNAFNFVDNIDLGYFSSAIPSLFFFFICSYLYDFDIYLEILAIIYFGGLIIFALFNRFPSKIFLGEIGSAQLTAIILILSYFFVWKEREFVNHQTSLFEFLKNNLFYTFIFIDFLVTSMRRIYLRKSLYSGDTNHISHKFTKIIPVNYFSLYVIILGILSTGFYYILENHLNSPNWQNILIVFSYYIFILIINLVLYFHCLKKNVSKSKV